MKIMQEEIFGPVVAIAKFKDVEDVLQKAHDTFYGLAASVHTRNLNIAIEVSNRLQAGSVWVNCHNFLSHQMPFGGFKQSGIGRELGYGSVLWFFGCVTWFLFGVLRPCFVFSGSSVQLLHFSSALSLVSSFSLLFSAFHLPCFPLFRLFSFCCPCRLLTTRKYALSNYTNIKSVHVNLKASAPF